MSAVVELTTKEGKTVTFTGGNGYRQARRFADKHGLPRPVAPPQTYKGPKKQAGVPVGPKLVRIGEFEFEPLVTYEELAAELGVSWQRVQQIEKRALEKLGQALRARGFVGAEG